jgi:hypothetical protein
MTKSKFTPGPWAAKKAIAAHREHWTIHANSQFIASTGDVENFGYEQEANAELMADAPRMLEVLRKVLTYSEHLAGWQHIDDAEQAFGDAHDLLEKHGG